MERWQEIVCASAREWEGTPYVPKGRIKGVGVDCGGLLYEVYNPVCGDFPPMPDDYSQDWSVHVNNERYLDFIMPFVNEVPEVVIGGFSLFHMAQNFAHAAIFLDNEKYIHAWGRLRAGRVTTNPVRVMLGLNKQQGNGFPLRHFVPKPELIKV